MTKSIKIILISKVFKNMEGKKIKKRANLQITGKSKRIEEKNIDL